MVSEHDIVLIVIIVVTPYFQQNYGNSYYAKGQNMVVMLTRAYDEALKTYDVLVMPTLPYKAPKLPAQDATLWGMCSLCSKWLS